MHNMSLHNQDFIWMLTVAFGFPILVIVLGEVVHLLQMRRKPLAATVRIVKNLVLPVFMFMIFFKYILKVNNGESFVEIVETLFWISVIHAALSLINTILFAEAEANTWRARMPKLLTDLFRLFLVLLGTAWINCELLQFLPKSRFQI